MLNNHWPVTHYRVHRHATDKAKGRPTDHHIDTRIVAPAIHDVDAVVNDHRIAANSGVATDVDI